jgi:hypothetical protein
MSEAEQRAVNAARSLGVLIFLHDRAAAIGTDEVRKLKGFDKDQRLHGYITERRGDAIRVTFYGAQAGAADAPLYRVTVPNSGAPPPAEVVATAVLLSRYEAGAVAARKLALAEPPEPVCSMQYNSVVIPAAEGGPVGWAVYLLPGTTDAKVLPVGGAHRMEINPDATRVVSRRAFTRSCLTVANDPQAVALSLTHLLDPQPTELHVFWSLRLRKPLMVSTPPAGSLWAVSGQGIRLVERGRQNGGQ